MQIEEGATYKETTETDLERTVRAAIARIREIPADQLTITEINVMEMLEAAVMDWRKVPKQALVDALRNSPGNCGLSNLSRQDKADLINAANRLIAAGPDYAASFKANLDREIAFRRR